MTEAEQIFAYERYLDQRGQPGGVVRDDLPYSPNLDVIVTALTQQFGSNFTHGGVYQAISHMARRPGLDKRGLRRESGVPLYKQDNGKGVGSRFKRTNMGDYDV